MIDPFSVELRRHLIGTADETVSADQVEAIERLVATTPQRSPWLVRLTWLVSPVGPFASAGVRASVVAAAGLLVVASAFGVAGLGGSQGARDPFEGRWASTDPADGSAQTLVIGPVQAREVHFQDAFASACHAADDRSTRFRAEGSGRAEAGRLVVLFSGGGCDSWQVPPFEFIFDHDSVGDTLVDNQGTTWHRVEEPSSAPQP